MKRFKPIRLKTTVVGRNGKKYLTTPLTVGSLHSAPKKSNTVRDNTLQDEDFELSSSSSTRAKRAITSSLNWEKIRGKLLEASISEQFLPEHQICVECEQEAATIRCSYCGVRQYLCNDCAKMLHCKRNQFHVLELWKDGMFCPLYPEHGVVGYGHQCQTKFTKLFKLVDASGNHHLKFVEVCNCESHAETLLRCQFWPASPEKPNAGFHIKIMDIAEKMFLHCHVSLKNITEVFEEIIPQGQPFHVKSIYSILNSGCFEEYRLYKHKQRHLSSFFPDLDNGTVCPLCPTDNGILIESMDACFGLYRKKRKGSPLGLSGHYDLMFADQDDVDNFVDSYGNKGSNTSQDCNTFHAGEVLPALRSKGKNKLLDEKGIFGKVCRHDFPKGFLNIKHGERISYSVYMLKHLKCNLQEKPNVKLVLMYDIACTLASHLKSSSQDNLLSGIDLAIPIFHCYGHKALCQVKYSPRRTEGIGLTDGEGTERLWSFLRQFSCITKEMGPEKRLDVLTDALLHYGEHLITRFGPLLKLKIQRTSTMLQKAEESFQEIIKGLTVPCNESTIKTWKEQAINNIQPKEEVLELLWDEAYVDGLMIEKKLRNELSYVQEKDQDKVVDVEKKLKRNGKALFQMEKRNGIRSRWDGCSEAFLNAKTRLMQKKRSAILMKLHLMSSERAFLLEMKKKYADGQAIAVKISTQITKVVSSMNKTIAAYNSWHGNSGVHTLGFEDIKDPNSSIFQGISGSSTTEEIDVPVSLKRKVVDSFCLVERIKEEGCLLKAEMESLITFHRQQQQLIELHLQNPTAPTDLNHGLSACLRFKQALHCQEVRKLSFLFKGAIDVPFPEAVDPPLLYQSLSDNSSWVSTFCTGDENTDDMYIEEDIEEEEKYLFGSSDSETSDFEL